jgi:hypothetical protein
MGGKKFKKKERSKKKKEKLQRRQEHVERLRQEGVDEEFVIKPSEVRRLPAGNEEFKEFEENTKIFEQIFEKKKN